MPCRWRDRTRVARTAALAESVVAHIKHSEKRAASDCQRPKSREETPKEGGGNARDRIAALHQYAPAPHKTQGVLSYYFGPNAASVYRSYGRIGSRAPA
jgi:hypothetical protein